MEGLNSKTLQAHLNMILMPLTFMFYFPLKKNLFFNWKTLNNVLQQPNIAADLSAQNSTVARKRRPIIESATGDLPLMTISRQMERSEIKEYQTALALAGNDSKAREIVQYWADDVTFCYTGINAEYEYISWALLSNAGNLAFTTSNNAYFANEFNLNYQVDSDKKVANTTAWSNAAAADPIGDMRTVVKAAKAKGIILRHVWINLDNWYLLQNTDQVKKLTTVYVNGSTSVETLPSKDEVNVALKKIADLQNLTIHVIDQIITRESKDGTYTSANPFADNVAVYSETEMLGTSQYSVLEQNDPAIIYARREQALIKKYSTQEPLTEITIGESDGIPVLDTAYRNYYQKTNTVAW